LHVQNDNYLSDSSLGSLKEQSEADFIKLEKQISQRQKGFIESYNTQEEEFSMETTNLKIRTDKLIKEEAEEIFSELGIDMTAAINMFLKETVRVHGMPFEQILDKPNKTTKSAIGEGRKKMNAPSSPRYSSIDSLKIALDK